MSYLLGVDGGNSKTLAVLAEQSGRVVGVGRGGNSNHQGRPVTLALDQICLAVDAALARARVCATDVDVTYYAVVGADLADDFALLEPALATLRHGCRFGLNNGTIAALRSRHRCAAGFDHGPADTAGSRRPLLLHGHGRHSGGRRGPAPGAAELWRGTNGRGGSTMSETAATGDEGTALLALTANPVVPSYEVARSIWGEIRHRA